MNNADSTPPAGRSEALSRQFIDYGRYFVPEREKQMQVIVGLLPIQGPSVILEQCCGDGLLAEKLLERYPQATLYGFDGSTEMLSRAPARLARFGEHFRAHQFDLAAADWRALDWPINGVFSSLAIHHLTAHQKQELFGGLYHMLSANGVLVIADMVEHTNAAGRRLAADMWDEVVRRQARELDGHPGAFDSFSKVRWNSFRYPEPDDLDKPSPLFDQLRWLEQAGFEDVDVYCMLAGHAIFGARKPGRTPS